MLSRLFSVFRQRRLERDLDDEIAGHIAMQEAEFRRAGMTPQAAHAAAMRQFGGVTQAKEDYRDRRGLPWLETALRGARYALRGLRRSPGFAAASVLSLAIGIGVNTAIFSMFHALVLRALPVARPAELVSFYRTGGWGSGIVSWKFYLEARGRNDLFQSVAARSAIEKIRLRTGASDRLENAQREFVSDNYFGTLGVRAQLGRLFTEEDNRASNAHPLAVLSYDYWANRFAADPAVLGRTLIVDEQPLTIVGVAARGFRGVEVERHPDLWVPAMMARGDIMEPGRNWVWIVARRRPEVSRPRIQAAVTTLFANHLSHFYGNNPVASFRRMAMNQKIEVREGASGLSRLRDQFGRPLAVLMAAVGLVLLAACANVAHLLLARGAARQREIALRYSLGATRARLITQSLTETLILALAGGIAGTAFALWGERVIIAFLPPSSGDPFPVSPDLTVLGFTLAVSLLSAILFGIVPALKSTAAGLPRARVRNALVIAQVAFSTVLVVLAGLFGQSLSVLHGIELGFRNQDVIALSLDYPQSWKPAQKRAARDRFTEAISAIPGVSRVSCGFPGPFLGGFSSASVKVRGSEAATKDLPWVSLQLVEPAYFETLGAAPLAGREFGRSDVAGSHAVALVNQAFVRQFLDGGAALGRVIEMQPPVEIIGVVPDIAHLGLREKVASTLYLPLQQKPSDWEPTIMIRAALPPGALASAMRRELAHISPEITASEPRTVRQRIDDSIFQDRLLATLSGFFGVIALALAAIGLYGVVAYGTARRSREIGIRVALGARRQALVWMVLRGALALVALGLAIGLPLSWAVAKQVGSVLFGVQPADTATYAGTLAVLLVCGVIAAWLPARRAASLDPNRVLRQD
jgi:predicted permease